jgi:hypothetical protein
VAWGLKIENNAHFYEPRAESDNLKNLGGKLSEHAQTISVASELSENRIVSLLETISKHEAERDCLQRALNAAEKTIGLRASRGLARLAWLLRRSIFPVGSFRSRAAHALGLHAIEAISGFESLVFNRDFYTQQMEEAPSNANSALRHYLMEGEAMGLRPNALFDPQFYALQVPGLKIGHGRALLHFLEHGMEAAISPIAEIDKVALRAKLAGMSAPVWLFTTAHGRLIC